MSLPLFVPNISNANIRSNLYSQCGNCSSENFLTDKSNHLFFDENKKCKCLDCGWTGTRYECKFIVKYY